MYQKLIIAGNLGRDPEMRYQLDGKAVTSFNLATSRRYKDKTETTWFRCNVWGEQAETASQYLKKGSKVLVEGRLSPDAETGSPKVFKRKDGTTGASYEVYVDSFRFLTSKSEDEASKEDASEEIPY